MVEKLKLYGWTAFLLLVMLAAASNITSCQSVPTPQTPRQVIAYADATLTGIIHAAATARELGRLDMLDAAQFKDHAKEAETYINLAKLALKDGDLRGMEANLATARKLLVMLNSLLLALEKQ